MGAYAEKTLRKNPTALAGNNSIHQDVKNNFTGLTPIHSEADVQTPFLGRAQMVSQRNQLQAVQRMADLSPQVSKAIQLQAMADSFSLRQKHPYGGNEASSGSTKPIQLYQPVDLKGELDKDSYEKRANAENMGNTGFGGDNLARATIILENGDEITLFAYSFRESAHSEENLIKDIIEKFGKETLQCDPQKSGKKRIKQIYTERAPCDTNTDKERKKRTETESDCKSYLSKFIHSSVPVYHSVSNEQRKHQQLMQKGKSRFITEIVNGSRKMTYQNAINRNKPYFKPFLDASLKLNKGQGRDYYSESRLTENYIAEFKDGGKLLEKSQEFRKMLTDAFESVPHYTDGGESKLVIKNIEEVAKTIKSEIDSEMNELNELDLMMESNENTDEIFGEKLEIVSNEGIDDKSEKISEQKKVKRKLFKPGRKLMGIRPYPKFKEKILEGEKKEIPKKDLDLARRIRENREKKF